MPTITFVLGRRYQFQYNNGERKNYMLVGNVPGNNGNIMWLGDDNMLHDSGILNGATVEEIVG
jgi:hypothetical protein